MTIFERKYSALFAALALAAGLAVGFAGSTLSYRYGLLPPPGERPFERMARALRLTPVQREQIRLVMRETHLKMRTVNEGFEQQRHAIFVDAYLRIHALLNPAQQKTFDARFVPPSVRTEARKKTRSQAPVPPSASPGPS